jgi:methylated-DNA-[protein]-cysteine S-methyltransferase
MSTISSPATTTATAVLETPLGPLTATVGANGLSRLVFEADLDAAETPSSHPVLEALADDLDRYFSGEALQFSVPVDLSGVSAFTGRVLRACAAVPHGATTTYGRLAESVGRPGAARAVGGALGANPVAIVVPCHRVVRGDGALGGYRSGTNRKRFLLALEGVA